MIGLLYKTSEEKIAELESRTQELRKVQSAAIEMHHKAEQRNEALKRSLLEKTDLLADFQDQIDEIEYILGIEPSKEARSPQERLALANSSAKTISYLLNNIPSQPPAKGGISSEFGYRLHPVSKVRRLHRGIDFRVNTGSPVYAPADAIVIDVRPSNKGSGNFLRLQHLGAFTSSYSHLSSFKVKVGDTVMQGDLIALSGATGISTGPHLHYEVRWAGKPLDPKPFLNVDATNIHQTLFTIGDVPWAFLAKQFERELQK
ncbi:peptidoglycan DD-metalloendopeptidase family protein [Vibrio mediterranei]|uniref:peptidoglycan DD-metalloendopeptidase family protein n=1 Tax=Vibrio mediterranei TaxID=689 RepID=UPI004068606A